MTYLPQLRASLVKAAGQRYGDAPEPQRRRGIRRRLTTGGLATACAAVVAIAVAAVALVALGNHQTSHRAASSPAVTKATLRRAASQTLGRLTLPPGAAVSGLVRGTPIELWSPSSRLAIADRVDVYRVWHLHQSPERVIAFIEAHRPPGGLSVGFGSESSGTSGPGGRPVIESATTTIGVPATHSGIWRELAVDAVSLGGGRTALRVDSQAGWLMPRPPSGLIPQGVTRVEFAWTLRLGAHHASHHASVVVTKPRRVKALVTLFNSLPTGRPGTGFCKRAPDGFIRFTFEARHDAAPLAVAIWAPPCQNLGLTIGRHPSVPLMANSPTWPAGPGVVEALLMVLPPHRVSAGSGRSGAT